MTLTPPNALTNDPARLYRYNRVASAPVLPEAITDAHCEAYHRDGYLAFEGVLTPAEVAETRAALTDLLQGRIPGYQGLEPETGQREAWTSLSPERRVELVRKVWRFCDFEPRLNRVGTAHPRIQGVLARLLGEPTRMIQDMALLKPPHIGTEKPWHQDMAYFNWGPPEKLIGVWIALDPATAENGCMHVLPGTHRDGPVPHHHVRDCQIPDDRVAVEQDVLVPLAPGGVLFFSALLHHGTPPNNSPNRRWALQYHYRAESALPLSRREHADLYFEGDLYAGCREGKGQPLSEITP